MGDEPCSIFDIQACSDQRGLGCFLCKSLGYPTSNGAILNGSMSLLYDMPLRRRWFGGDSGPPSPSVEEGNRM